MDAPDDSFVSRWSRRKAQARAGALPAEAFAVALPVAPPAPLPASEPAAPPPPEAFGQRPAAAPEMPPPPTLDDVALLTPASDYARFVAGNVAPEVKNAALKKLFTDPHFNVMDGLDTYIDDYNKPDPLPAGWLRQMVQSKLLGLFDDEEEAAPATPPPPGATAPAAGAGAPTAAATAPDPLPCLPADPLPDEDPDLQLQPDDAARRAGPEPCAGADAGRQH
jgi:hypothetical protein